MDSQAEVEADDLQILHAAHNLLAVLEQAKKQQLPGVDYSLIKASSWISHAGHRTMLRCKLPS